MPLSRRPRIDRRRRLLLDSQWQTDESSQTPKVRSNRTSKGDASADESSVKRGAGYSQSVRRACQHRLVQFIPVRKRSLIALVAFAMAIPATLALLHYGIFVTRIIPWDAHPAASIFDASQPRSLVAWYSSHLWLACLVTTVITFQLRRHKLDDYVGDYRLWFWMVLTCLIGSIDSTTRITEIFGVAIDHWCQINVGWSGIAIVQATLAVLIGMLGLRLCNELKPSPVSLVLWLVGLACWAASWALAQSIVRIDSITHEMRVWCRATLWLAGLTTIWLAGVVYLRLVYIEAQRRFIVRGKLMSAEPIQWRKQFVDISRKVVPSGLIRKPAVEERMSDSAEEYEKTGTAGGLGSRIVNTFRRKREVEASEKTSSDRPENALRDSAQPSTSAVPTKRWFAWRSNKSSPDGEQVDAGSTSNSTAPASSTVVKRSQPTTNSQQIQADDAQSKPARTLLSRLRFSTRQAAAETAGEGVSTKPSRRLRLPKIRMPKLRFPKLKLPSIRLPLPDQDVGDDPSLSSIRPANEERRSLPGTSSSQNAQHTINLDSARLSKAERKKLKRAQREDDQDRRAA